MATFPSLVPNTRSYDFGRYPVTEVPTRSAGIVRFKHADVAQGYRLNLGYTGLTDTQATLIRNHYNDQSGTYLAFDLPDAIWQGHSSTGNIAVSDTIWRYDVSPEEEHFGPGYINVTVSLVSDYSEREPTDGVAPSVTSLNTAFRVTAALVAGVVGVSNGFTITVASALVTNGAGGGAAGFNLQVTATLVEGAVGVSNGFDLQVTATLAEGAATGDAETTGFSISVASTLAEGIATGDAETTGLSISVTASLAEGAATGS